ncbi:hypothetical protein JL721_1241 [Aureococcus anophagefferens]|nr:hypothetical protein JL721_1241 [Aureococcus anophagefferens]
MVARVWLQPFVDAQNGRRETLCVVYLEHNNLSGAVSLQIRAPAGSEVVVDGGVGRVVVGKSATIPFSVAACVGRVSILPKATGFDYLLNWAGNGVAEVQQRTIESPRAAHAAGRDRRATSPAPPKKCLNPFQNQLDPDFVENRRVELNDFAKKMVVLPRVLVNPALLDFLGLALQPI